MCPLKAGQLAVLRGWKHVATAKAPALVGQAALLSSLRREDDEEAAEAVGGKRAHTGRLVWKVAPDEKQGLR